MICKCDLVARNVDFSPLCSSMCFAMLRSFRVSVRRCIQKIMIVHHSHTSQIYYLVSANFFPCFACFVGNLSHMRGGHSGKWNLMQFIFHQCEKWFLLIFCKLKKWPLELQIPHCELDIASSFVSIEHHPLTFVHPEENVAISTPYAKLLLDWAEASCTVRVCRICNNSSPHGGYTDE